MWWTLSSKTNYNSSKLKVANWWSYTKQLITFQIDLKRLLWTDSTPTSGSNEFVTQAELYNQPPVFTSHLQVKGLGQFYYQSLTYTIASQINEETKKPQTFYSIVSIILSFERNQTINIQMHVYVKFFWCSQSGITPFTILTDLE